MSKRAEAYIFDHSVLFFEGWKAFVGKRKHSLFAAFMNNLCDPDDKHRYISDDDGETQLDEPNDAEDICEECNNKMYGDICNGCLRCAFCCCNCGASDDESQEMYDCPNCGNQSNDCDECPHCDYAPRFENEDTLCNRCGKNPRQVPPEGCEFPGDYTICEICEYSSECPLCDAITGGRSWDNGNTCCVCQEITLCDACCPVIEGGHGDRCWSECIEEGYEHKICLRCEEEMLKPV